MLIYGDLHSVFLRQDTILATELNHKVQPTFKILISDHITNSQYTYVSLLYIQIRKVNPTLDMVVDEGDNYTHIQERNRVG